MKKIPVIIDCDPGHDDAMALAMAFGSEKLDVRLVTTVSGNSSLEKVTQNCLNVLNYIGAKNIPVAMGYPYGIVRNYAIPGKKEDSEIEGAEVHGVTGLDGFDFPKDNPLKIENIRAVEAMAKVIRDSEEKVVIIPVGPLTNIGLLIRVYPDLINKIEKISFMGGTSEFILKYPYMEFNTYMDPEATDIVFKSGIPLYMYGYDVTYKVMYDSSVLDRISKIGNNTSKMVVQLLEEFRKNHNSYFKAGRFGDTSPIHDACAVAGVIDPSLVTDVRYLHADIEVSGEFMDGATLVDVGDILNREKNVNVVYDMDSNRFFDLFIETIKRCD